MKKRIIIVLFLIISLFTITACKDKNKENIPEKIEEDRLIINDYDLTLNKDEEFENLKYKIPDGTSTNNYGNYIILDYNNPNNEEEVLFNITITKYGYVNVDDIVKEIKEKKKINGLEWIVSNIDGHNTYAIQDGHNTYTVSFIFDENLNGFEEEFMKNIKIIE